MGKTLLLPADANGLRLASEALRRGDLVAFPTDTVYGVGAHLFLTEAVGRIYEAKGRAEKKPIAVLLADTVDLSLVARALPEGARRLGERFWPGGLTLVLPAGDRVPEVVRAGGATVGVRVPDHPLARALIRAVGVPLATTSANRSGEPSPTTAAAVLEQLGGRVAYVLEGECPGGVASTVVNLAVDPPTILREGAIPRSEIERVLGRAL